MIDKCPVCRGHAVDGLLKATLPVLMTCHAGEAVQPDWFAEFDLVICQRCGHAFNRAFDEDLALLRYRHAPLPNAPVSPAMMGRLVSLRDWLSDVLNGQRVLEIGCGTGHLARVLSQTAGEVVVYEPCIALTKEMVPETNIRLVTSTYPRGQIEDVDVVVCRQVIEHVAAPFDLLRDIRRSLPTGGHAYLEVPNAEFVATHAALPDLHLQHVQYFTRMNFCALAAQVGLMAVRTLDLVNGHDFGVLFKAVDHCDPLPFARIGETALAERLAARRARATRTIASLPGPVALYGACPHSQIFLNHVGSAARFAAVLDDNPSNRGRALYNTEQVVPVVDAARARLADYGAIVIGAYLHDAFIADRVRGLGARCPLLTINPVENLSPVASGLASVYG